MPMMMVMLMMIMMMHDHDDDGDDDDGEDGDDDDVDDDGDDGEGDFRQYSVFQLSQDSSMGRILYIFPKRYCPWRNFPNSYIAVGFCFMKYEI